MMDSKRYMPIADSALAWPDEPSLHTDMSLLLKPSYHPPCIHVAVVRSKGMRVHMVIFTISDKSN